MSRILSSWVMYAGLAVSMSQAATWPKPSWIGVSLGIVIIMIGAAIKRFARKSIAEEIIISPKDSPRAPLLIQDSLSLMIQNLQHLIQKAEELPFDDIKREIEQLLILGPETLGTSQESIIAKFGFTQYANMMGPLATAERLLYRAWSAAADKHKQECLESLRTALTYAEESANEVNKAYNEQKKS